MWNIYVTGNSRSHSSREYRGPSPPLLLADEAVKPSVLSITYSTPRAAGSTWPVPAENQIAVAAPITAEPYPLPYEGSLSVDDNFSSSVWNCRRVLQLPGPPRTIAVFAPITGQSCLTAMFKLSDKIV